MQQYRMAVIFIAALIVFVAVVRRLYKNHSSPLPRYKERRVMTDNEIEFFHRIKQALPEHYIFPQVAMSAIIEPSVKGKEFAAANNRINRKVIDFCIYDIDLNLVCIIELDDKTHQRAKDVARDKLTLSAGIATIRWMSQNKPTPDEIRAEVLKLKATLP